MRRSTIAWGRRRTARWTRRRGNIDLWVAIAIAAGLIAYQRYRHWNPEPHPVIIGRARVIDGDTVDIAGARIRLKGIDAPELEQTCTDRRGEEWACGKAATRELRAHVQRQELTCDTRGLDQYRRVLAICSLPTAPTSTRGWCSRAGPSPQASHLRTMPSKPRRNRASAGYGREASCRRGNGGSAGNECGLRIV